MAKKLDISKLAQRLNELNENSNRGNGGGIKFLSINDGRNVVRVLPPRDDMDSFGVEVWVHYGVGKTAQNKRGQMVVCPKTHGEDKPCPVCEASHELKQLSKAKDDSYDKQARGLYRKRRVYYNAIDRSEDLSKYVKEEEDGKVKWTLDGEENSPVKVLATGIGVYKDILKLIVDPEYGDVTDAEEGLDLIITKSGSGQFNTEYDVKTVRKETPIGFAEWEESLNDLKPLTKAKTYDELVKLLDGDTSSSDGDGEPEGNGSSESTGNDTAEGDDDLQDEIRKALERRRGK